MERDAQVLHRTGMIDKGIAMGSGIKPSGTEWTSFVGIAVDPLAVSVVIQIKEMPEK